MTSLSATKQGPALIGRLSGEAKSDAKTLGVAAISALDGATQILDHLDKSYGVDSVDQLDIDLANFFEFSWSGNMTVEENIAGFHARIDKIAELALDSKLKGHLLLQQAGLDNNTRNMIVGAASGNYSVDKVSTAMRQAFRNIKNSPHGNTSTSRGGQSRGRRSRNGRGRD